VASQGSSQTPNPPPGSPPPGDGEAGRIKSIDTRFTAIEEEQRKQGGILERIERALGGGAPKEPSADPAGSGTDDTTPAGGVSIKEQIRRGVQEIQDKQRADAEAAAAATQEQAWRQSVEDRLPERRPTEPMTGVKNRIQRALFGKQDER
jgi:hypothetical protein